MVSNSDSTFIIYLFEFGFEFGYALECDAIEQFEFGSLFGYLLKFGW